MSCEAILYYGGQMKKGLLALASGFVISIMLALIPGIASAELSGIAINDCEELQQIGSGEIYTLDADYYLANDIDCSDTENWNDGAGFLPIGFEATPFTGKFDGNNKIISGLHINGGSAGGLFAYVMSGDISNVGLTGVDIYGSDNTGGLVGVLDGTAEDQATIASSYVTGTVMAGPKNTGGLVGLAKINTSITDSYTNVILKGMWGAGGLVGRSEGYIAGSYALGSVTSDWGFGIGGLVGKMYGGEITKSYATGEVTASYDNQFNPDGYYSSYAGGLVGYSVLGDINQSFATGNVTGAGIRVGGLVGGSSGTITNCYTTTRVM